MEGFLSTLPPIRTVYAPPVHSPGWEKRDGRFLIPQGLNYLEICKAILSQVNPPLPPAPLKGDTRECGVQVNARVDKPVQCSLGPKTLFCEDHQSDSTRSSPGSDGPGKDRDKAASDSPPTTPRCLSRPVSVCSPLFDLNKLVCPGEGESGAVCESERTAGQRPPRSFSYQFLEQRYGFFHCKKCNIRWESAYVWCISGTNKVYYKQLCRKCQVGFNPYRVESIICKGCSETCCTCERKQRHINMKRPHRQDLCCRCRGMRLSCDATYSFKYIV